MRRLDSAGSRSGEVLALLLELSAIDLVAPRRSDLRPRLASPPLVEAAAACVAARRHPLERRVDDPRESPWVVYDTTLYRLLAEQAPAGLEETVFAYV